MKHVRKEKRGTNGWIEGRIKDEKMDERFDERKIERMDGTKNG
jgi:hypothetical protein